MQSYEQLGAFYLGRQYDIDSEQTRPSALLYDSKDLTTHAVIVGMTGSGKTGLGISLLEEAAIDGVPSLIIDPKGDMANLLLTFPGLSAREFRPWIDPAAAARNGQTPDEFAKDVAKTWKRGLAEWDQTPERVQRLRDAVDTAIYTPGSDAGIGLNVLRSLDAPPPAVLSSSDAVRERVTACVSGLLALLGIDADPLRSREHTFLATLLDHEWRAGRNLSIPKLIQAIQSPPFSRIGIMDVDTIYPPADRMQLAMTLNNLIASPGFSAWMNGQPLNIQRLLFTADGRPRMSILSIAHLDDRERMFFVTTLLNEVIAWMRGQSGTSSLRALLYMDELFGYLPPTANPPSKTPLLTLLKQARAFGLGLVLSTQNPVDLDYKALSNAGTWFLGRLQTERDKRRVLDGLEGASLSHGGFDRQRTETVLAGLGNRVFLMHNVHDTAPAIFQTRWALSYLRGPLTREQIRHLAPQHEERTSRVGRDPIGTHQSGAPQPQAVAIPTADSGRETARSAARSGPVSDAPWENTKPLVPVGVEERFVIPSSELDRIIYRAGLLGVVRLHFIDRRSKLDVWEQRHLLWRGDVLPDDVWASAETLDTELELERTPANASSYAPLLAAMGKASTYKRWRTTLKNFVYQTTRLALFHCEDVDLRSKHGETEGDFRARIKHAASEKRDLAIEKLRKRYLPRLDRLEDRLRRAQHRVEVEQGQAQNATISAAVSWGTSLLGALLGRKKVSTTNVRRVGSSLRSTSRAAQQRGDIRRAKDNVEDLRVDIEGLEQEFDNEVDDIKSSLTVSELEIVQKEVSPRKSDIVVERMVLVWIPEEGI